MNFIFSCVSIFLSYSLKEFLPKEYIKQRGSEKTIFQVGSQSSLVDLFLTSAYPMTVLRVFRCVMFVYFNPQDHKDCGEMTEIEAKVKYVKLARSLRTYGVSFFLVKVS